MCGILSILRSPVDTPQLRSKALTLSKKIRHRGPDWNGVHIQHVDEHFTHVFAHERLAIVNPESGHQPLFDDTGKICVTVNGEIYNYKDLIELLHTTKPNLEFNTKSDCGVIPFLYQQYGTDFLSLLDGVFAFTLSDESTGEFLIARDPIGVFPLYIGYSGDGSIFISSEMKCIIDDCIHFEEFPPGSYMTSHSSSFQRYYNPTWFTSSYNNMKFSPFNKKSLFECLSKSVEKRLMSDVPYAVLLSGGLDSSIIAYLVNEKFKASKAKQDSDKSLMYNKLHTFSIGMKNSPDTQAARKVAEFLGTVHHEFNFDLQEGIDALKDVIYHLETYDVTTIRASTPMYFLARLIKSLGIKMVLSGEGSDEIFGGYLYFSKAPNAVEFFNETVLKVKLLHYYDLLRANKSTMAWGVEVRVPFLDKEFLDLAMTMDPLEKLHSEGRIEKHVLREAFEEFLPQDIVWRQKEQFSDGVGYGWIDGLRDYAGAKISDQQMNMASSLFPYNTPATKEAYYYRQLFAELFPHGSADKLVHGGPSIACSTPAAIEWDESFKKNADQSGRAVIGVHNKSKFFEEKSKKGDVVENNGL